MRSHTVRDDRDVLHPAVLGSCLPGQEANPNKDPIVWIAVATAIAMIVVYVMANSAHRQEPVSRLMTVTVARQGE